MDNFRKTLTGAATERVGINSLTPTQEQNRFLRTNLGSYEGTYLEPLFGEDFSGGLGYRDVRTGEQIWQAKYAVNAINTSYDEYAAGNWTPGTQQRTNAEAQTITPPAQNDPGAAAAAGDTGTAQQASVGSVTRRPTNLRTSRQSLTLQDINPNAATLLGG